MSRLPEDKRLQFVPQDQRPPLTPQLALRVAVIGTLALAMFAIIFFRLWFLQVLSGDQYLAQAAGNRVRNIDIPAPRGQIVDRGGTVLVDSKAVPAVVISPPDLPTPMTTAYIAHPPPRDAAMYRRLAAGARRVEQAQEMPRRRLRQPVAATDRLLGGPAVRAPALRHGDGQDRRVEVHPVLPPGAPGSVRGRAGRTGVAAQVPAQRAGLAAVRDGRPDQLPGGPPVPLQGSAPELDRRAVRPGVVLRQVPARPGRHRAGAGRRPGSVPGHAAHQRAQPRPLAQAVARRTRAARRPGGPADLDRQQLSVQRRCLRGHEPGQRRGLRDGVAAHLRPQHLHQAGLRSRSTSSSTTRRATSRSSTGPSRARARPARPSSRSPPPPPWRAACGAPARPTTTPASSARAAACAAATPEAPRTAWSTWSARSASPRTPSSTTWAR